MIIYDRVYGKVEIKEKILIDLINSKPLQRLKKIKQAGISGYIVDFKKDITRFEHSLGVMILLRKYDADLKEQIAGLLHDISHTAFSHVVDFVYSNDEHEFHELHYKNTVLKTEIFYILKSNCFDIEDFLDIRKFKLLERNIPDLCADRIDYFLRDRNARLGKNGDKFIKNLIVYNEEFVFNHQKDALKFAKEYLYQNKISWYSSEEGYYYIKFAQILKKALRQKVISKNDLFTNDETVLNKLKMNQKINEEIKIFLNPVKLKITQRNGSIFIKSKPRFVDPKILIDGKVKILSEINLEFKNFLKKEIDWMKKGFWVKCTID